MKYNPEKHHRPFGNAQGRRSIRLKGYDYTQAGAYFITICTYDKTYIFGEVINGKMRLNEYGEIVKTEWLETAQMRNNVELDEYVVMPNHLHGILVIVDDDCRGTMHRAPTCTMRCTPAIHTPQYESFGKPVSGSVPIIVRGFKSTVTKQINKLRDAPGVPLWQRNYYEHVVRNEKSLNRIRQYIINNPANWGNDIENIEIKTKIDRRKYFDLIIGENE